MDKIMVDDEKAAGDPYSTTSSPAEPDETDDLLYWFGRDKAARSASPEVDSRFIL